MPTDADRLAELLWSYEADEPHWDEPEGRGHYPPMPRAEFAALMATEHEGDCTNLPGPCSRCWAEHIAHKARWLAARLAD